MASSKAQLHNDDEILESSLLHSWQAEQHKIASQVVVPESSKYHATRISERYTYLSPYNNSNNNNGQTEGKKYLLIGGVDVSFPADDEANEDAVAVYVILRYETSSSDDDEHNNSSSIMLFTHHQQPKVIYRSHKYFKLTTPYIPSYLAFREIDPLIELITQQCQTKPHLTPDVILVDGNGQWHDRYAGLACFVGVRSGIPTVGVGKTFYSLDNEMKKDDVVRDVKRGVQCWYYGAAHHRKQEDCRGGLIVDNESIPYNKEMELEKQHTLTTTFEDVLIQLHQVSTGVAIPMRSGIHKNDKVLAYALIGHGGNTDTSSRSNSSSSVKKKKKDTARGSKNPIYVSCGSHISLLDAVSLVAWTSIVRIPEPIREADLHGRQLLREKKK